MFPLYPSKVLFHLEDLYQNHVAMDMPLSPLSGLISSCGPGQALQSGPSPPAWTDSPEHGPAPSPASSPPPMQKAEASGY